MKVCRWCQAEIPTAMHVCPVCGCLAVALVVALTFLLMLLLAVFGAPTR